MKRIIFLFFIFVTSLCFTQSNQNPIYPTNYEGIKISIELANPKIYRVGDEIILNINVYNPTNTEKSFLMAQDKKFSFDIEMVNMQNRAIDYKKEYIISVNRPQAIFNSLIRLGSLEGYSYQIALNDYFDINVPGQFYIKARFFPNLKLNFMGTPSNNEAIISNQLTINIRPKDIKEEYIAEIKSIEEEKKLYAEKKSPDEVVTYMLEARMNQEWEKFFLYLDLEKLIEQNSIFKDKIKKVDIEKKKEVIDSYKEYLKRNTIDEISYLPHSFKILKTEYTEGKGKVDVLIEFKYIDYIEKKYYTYFLSKKGNIWYIDSYQVMNLGTK
ncbi:MAG TPA: hypothetical protein PLE45_10085 [Spirochaetota bacterium]|nr:hypothetical protein [Spirochaetota bacterium]HOL57487.1 hypothetical protein [Spirochaetota bacterium]HPP05030.1 hypothetical protein [Spirochaetota bacterium]